MEKDPANRFQTADELRQTLNAYLAGRQVDVPEPTRVIGAVPAGGAGTTETRVMSDQTQAMARPAGIGNTAVRSGSGMSSSASGGADPYGGKKKGGKGKIVAGVVAALAIIGIIAFAAFSALNSGAKTVTVPNVLGYTQEDATEELRSRNLGVKTSSGYSDEYEEGEVMSQTPSGGLQVEEGYEVEIQISRGPEPVKTTTVPDLKGRTREEAEKLLEEAGLLYLPLQLRAFSSRSRAALK